MTPSLIIPPKTYSGGAISSNSSSSTINNPLNALANNNNLPGAHTNKNYRFEYYHVLNPTLNEFRWHLNDEIFQLQHSKMKNKRVFDMYIGHIREGVRRTYTHCRLSRRKIVLNKRTTTTTKTAIDVNKARMIGLKPNAKPAFRTNIQMEEDKSILSVDSKKFFQEFVSIIKTIENTFFKCQISKIQTFSKTKLQQMSDSMAEKTDKLAKEKLQQRIESLEQMNDSCYYLTCMYEEPLDHNKWNQTKAQDLNQSFKKPTSLSFKILIKLVNETLTIKPEQTKPLVDQVTVINQMKINTYYSFSQSSFQNKEHLIDSLIVQFNQQINALVKSVYLTLTLREIHETRKWNNLLVLKEDTLGASHNSSSANSKANSTGSPSVSQKSDTTDESANSSERNESLNTVKNQNSQNGNKLSCSCVWNILFKLHRLHQTVQKKHGTAMELTLSNSFDQHQVKQQLQQQQSVKQDQQQQQVPETPTMQQQFISQGLKKLQEYLVNFRIEESNSGDLYVYTRKNEIFLLKLEEVYEIPNENVGENANDSGSQASHGHHGKTAGAGSAGQNVKVCLGVSRRPSYASADFDAKLNQGRSQNPSGGSNNSTATTITGTFKAFIVFEFN